MRLMPRKFSQSSLLPLFLNSGTTIAFFHSVGALRSSMSTLKNLLHSSTIALPPFFSSSGDDVIHHEMVGHQGFPQTFYLFLKQGSSKKYFMREGDGYGKAGRYEGVMVIETCGHYFDEFSIKILIFNVNVIFPVEKSLITNLGSLPCKQQGTGGEGVLEPTRGET